jgi:hypothetical protein
MSEGIGRRRELVGLAVVAATTAVLAVAIVRGAPSAEPDPVPGDAGRVVAAPVTSGPATPSASPTVPDQSIVEVVQSLLPGAQVRQVNAPAAPARPTWSAVMGSYAPGGQQVANIVLETYPNRSEPGDPCAPRAIGAPGRQGAAAPEDVCTSVPQPDGTMVWIRRDGFSATRPWTTADTRNVQAFHFRSDGRTVNLRLDNMINPDPPTYYTPAFEVTDAQLVAVVTAPEVAQIIL